MEQEASKTIPSIAAISALQRGNKIEAIKLVRQEQGLGLKEAKDVVEAYLEKQPALQASLAAAQSGSGRRALLWLALLLGIGVLVYLLVFRS